MPKLWNRRRALGAGTALALAASAWILFLAGAWPVPASGSVSATAVSGPTLSPPPVRPGVAEECLNPAKPWDYDPAPAEAAAKIRFHEARERSERWSQEPTANELAMDAVYYDLRLSIDPQTQIVTGTVRARLRVDAAQATEVDLDLVNEMAVSAVTAGGMPAAYSHVSEILTITLDRVYTQGEVVEVSVSYAGHPPGSYGAFGFNTEGGQPMIWTLSEPFGARSWWACDDWSDDKADSMDIRVTVPAGLIVASNGTLREVAHGGATDTYWWHEQYPIATYLVSLAIHPYAVYSDYYEHGAGEAMEIQFYIFPADSAATYGLNMMTDDMITYFASVFGEYPFLAEKYGHAQFPWGGAMEHQTCTSMGAFYETIIAHELAHQWWGDMVTCADFHHIWLNEGFAVYSEALWLEHQYGPEGYWGKMNATRYFGGGTIYVPDLDDWGRIFDTSLTYYKASWVVHMLRGVIGDDAFWQTLADYRAAFEYGAARTADLQAIAEANSGLDLTDFFQQWIYGEYYPFYSFTWENQESQGQWELRLAVDQIQTNTGLFHMPVEIRVQYAGGATEDFVVDNSLAHEEYVLALSGPAELVTLDPHEWILKRVAEPVVDPTFADGILLVNGVDWSNYGNEIRSAYDDRAFWGDLEISFWDCFSEPAGGYPATLPAPLGHGRVPAPVLGRFSTVIWVGNNYNGDLYHWLNTSISSYLEAGGNVLLMTRQGDSFLDAGLRGYLGITLGNGSNIYDCVSVHGDLTNIARIGAQSYCSVFHQALTQETSRLLYLATQGYNPDMGIGVWRRPVDGGTHNPRGAQFAFLSGRPYRWNHVDLRTNVQTIVERLFGVGSDVAEGATPRVRLDLRAPSPALGTAAVGFSLPLSAETWLRVYDTQGRAVRTLFQGRLGAGHHSRPWDGRDGAGVAVSAGVYYLRLDAGERGLTRPVLLVR